MNLYDHNLSLLDFDHFAFSSSIDDPFSHRRSSAFLNSGAAAADDDDDYYDHRSLHGNGRYRSRTERRVSPNRAAPPRHHRHDGTSPLPMGLDWSPPPRKLDGRDSVWPHDPHTGWSYCVIIPSWTSHRKSSGSDPVVLKKAFPSKDLPPAPPKKLLRIKSRELLEERRSSLEDWMQKLLSDIEISRSLETAMFLELEAAVRSSFSNVDQQSSDVNSSASDAVPSTLLQTNSDASAATGNSFIESDYGDEIPHEISELGTTKHGIGSSTDFGMGKSTLERDVIKPPETTARPLRLDGTEFISERERSHAQRLSTESVGSDLSSVRATDLSNLNGDTDLTGGSGAPRIADTFLVSDFQLRRDLVVTLPSDERQKLNRWDMEELRRKCMELELKLKSEEEAKVSTELNTTSVMHENKMLLQELDVAREQLDNLQKHHEEFELKSKTDVKVLVKEVKSLRNSQSELKQELSRLMKEKLEVERVLQKEKQRAELADTANTKLLHECGILRSRLQECSVNFLIEEEDKLIVDTSLPSDAIDLLVTSDNRIGLLLAEAQLLAQDIENSVTVGDESCYVDMNNGGENRKSDDELRKMVTDILVDNATLRKQVNSVIRCSLKTGAKAETEDDDDNEDDASLRKTVLGKFLER
ncbi:hypothetical protein TIFTF001_019137 [Ficus carica]|uniref:PX domain-containing protein n=1 Tax=Ficus carica TaxID=3494 RepID=A0AA88ACU3_FICCA|nr:hypothetical protein TIFTF001_019137 [Ficus carica]